MRWQLVAKPNDSKIQKCTGPQILRISLRHNHADNYFCCHRNHHCGVFWGQVLTLFYSSEVFFVRLQPVYLPEKTNREIRSDRAPCPCTNQHSDSLALENPFRFSFELQFQTFIASTITEIHRNREKSHHTDSSRTISFEND